MAKTYTPALSGVDYTADASGTARQALELYRPDGDGPFPVLVTLLQAPEKLGATLTTARTLEYVARAEGGYAVVLATYTDAGFDPARVLDDPEGDAATIVQHLRENAATYKLDADRMVLRGTARAANAAAWPALGPDLANPGAGTEQEKESSRVAGVILEDVVARWSDYDQAATKAFAFLEGPTAALSTVAGATQDANSPAIYGSDARNALLEVFLASSAAVEVPQVQSLGSAYNGQEMAEVLTAVQAVVEHYDRTVDGNSASGVVSGAAIEFLYVATDYLPKEEQVLRAVIARLKTITWANGYRTNVRRVYRHGADDPRAWPAIMVRSLRTSYGDEMFGNKFHNGLFLGLVLQIAGWQRQEERVSRFIADVRGVLGLADAEPLDGKCNRLRVEDGQRFTDTVDGENRSGASLFVHLTFRDLVGAPYNLSG